MKRTLFNVHFQRPTRFCLVFVQAHHFKSIQAATFDSYSQAERRPRPEKIVSVPSARRFSFAFLPSRTLNLPVHTHFRWRFFKAAQWPITMILSFDSIALCLQFSITLFFCLFVFFGPAFIVRSLPSFVLASCRATVKQQTTNRRPEIALHIARLSVKNFNSFTANRLCRRFRVSFVLLRRSRSFYRHSICWPVWPSSSLISLLVCNFSLVALDSFFPAVDRNGMRLKSIAFVLKSKSVLSIPNIQCNVQLI